ncbi:glycosyltransferase family 41 protein [Pseudemcibacter aquimaris]|uniref:O-linked N-acetylglucosamine transferase, SPINDLY family protein n=1 Tax=Pseudemcibacter aquimaris TaxID=2857064 RepID=UPI002012406E|nr:glycosyltransferase family 41 protein [Pseudemcibacter aquimaris]MCC3860137.1 hypothetical protein [Pseudemcibacter aquimaris]WDU57464.1 hypothetical protein KW060_09670 [Pseudemcibacter aquimaris]
MSTNVRSLFEEGLKYYKAKNNFKAKECFLSVCKNAPDFWLAYEMLGHASFATGDFLLAKNSFEEAIRRAGNGIGTELLVKYARVQIELRNFKSTEEICKYLVDQDPNLTDAWMVLGDCYKLQFKTNLAMDCFEHIFEQDPTNINNMVKLHRCYHDMCMWDDAKKLDDKLYSISSNLMQTGEAAPLTVYDAMKFIENGSFMRDLAENECKKFIDIMERSGVTFTQYHTEAKQVKKKGKIKLGFFSSCLSRHVTAYVLFNFFDLFDRDVVEIHIFPVNPDQTCTHYEKISGDCDYVHELISMTDQEMAEKIASTEMDVLIDLDGFVGNRRMGVLAQKPAPIQIAWLGTPCTTGATWNDYALTDHVIAPAELEDHYTEMPLRMPNSYFFPNIQGDEAKELGRDYWNIPEDKFVFCSFNNSWKIDEATFLAWCEILRRAEDSVLWLMLENDETIENVKQKLQDNGIDPNRLYISGRVENTEHLSRFICSDLLLDSFICGAHTTCIEALGVGLPVLAKIGKPFYSRVSSSMLSAADLESLITHTKEEYIERAVEIAKNPDTLAALKTHLKENKDTLPLFDQKKWVKDFEDILVSVVKREK